MESRFFFILILFIIVHHSKGAKLSLKCHQCQSRKGNNKSCELGSDSNIRLCPFSKSNFCISLRSVNPITQESILIRDCADEPPVCGSFEISRGESLQGCPFACQEDACNGGEPGMRTTPLTYDRQNLQSTRSTQYTPYGSSSFNQQYQQTPGSQMHPGQQQTGGAYGQSTSPGQYGSQYGNTQYPGNYGSSPQQGQYGQTGGHQYSGSQYGQQPGSDSNFYGYNTGYNVRRSPNYLEVGKLILLLLMMRNQEQFQRQVG